MDLHVGTLRLGSLGTESLCLTILQDGHVYCLLSATCLSPYYSNSPQPTLDVNRIINDSSVWGEVSDIRSIQSFNMFNPKKNSDKRSTICQRNNTPSSDQTSDLILNNSTLVLKPSELSKSTDRTLESIFKRTKYVENESLPKQLDLYCKQSKASDGFCESMDSHMNHFAEGTENILVRPYLVYEITEAEKILNRMFKTQDFKMNNDDQLSREQLVQLSSTVVIFGSSQHNLFSMLSTLLSSLSPPTLGSPVLLVSNPFQNESLRYSWSSGILSSIVTGSPVFMTDARLNPGGNGAPVFSPEGGLLGLVICNGFRTSREVISFSLGISLQSIFGVVKPILNSPKCLSDTSRQVVLIRCGNDWGSGIILDAASGIILTCAHIVSARAEDISIRYLKEQYSARVIYETSKQSAFDVAVLSTDCKLENALSITMNPHKPQAGSGVTCAGYPIFNEHAMFPLSATLSSGILSKVFETPVPESIALSGDIHTELYETQSSTALSGERSISQSGCCMLQTTCTVHSGASGGALLDAAGSLIGIVVCNVMEHERNATVIHPNVNMALPVCSIYPILMSYLKTRDVNVLRSLNILNPSIRQVWNFEPIKSKL